MTKTELLVLAERAVQKTLELANSQLTFSLPRECVHGIYLPAMVQTGAYPKKLTSMFYAIESDNGSLAYELSSDGERWILYCPGKHHEAVGLGPDLQSGSPRPPALALGLSPQLSRRC